MKHILLFAVVMLYANSYLQAQMPAIQQITAPASPTEQYGKFEAVVALTATFDNPFDYDQVHLRATFTAPSGQVRTVDGFFMQDYTLNASNGSLAQVGSGEFRIRFAPDEVGTWQMEATLQDQMGVDSAEAVSFQCTAVQHPLNKGYVRTNMTNYLQYDNGEQYVPIGENMAWANGNPYLGFRNWLRPLSENGGNFIRLWHAHWGLGLEWANNVLGYSGLKRYKQNNSYYLDWLFDYCADNGVYIMLALQHHGQVSTTVNPNWGESPYNAANGGPCEHTWDFFTNETAKALTRNRLRYVVARWGYARSVMAWELFNEVGMDR